MKKLLLIISVVLCAFVGSLFAQEGNPKVYIAPMEDGFDGFISAALIKEKVPIVITTSDEGADYVIVGNSVKGNNKWYDTVFGSEKDRNQGSIKLLKKSDKTVVWAGSAGDKTFWFSALRKGGQQKVAERIAKQIHKEYFTGNSK